MTKKIKKVLIIVLVSLLAFPVVFVGCLYLLDIFVLAPETWKYPTYEFYDPPQVLHDIAYDVNPEHGYTIYIIENDGYVPYFVLTTDYNGDGNCLLLRKYLLDEMMMFNYPKFVENATNPNYKPSYYENSEIDKFLSGKFLETLSSIEDIIIESEIVITHIDSIGRTGDKSLTIKRKAFLLSYMEISGIESPIAVTEGITLKYFTDIIENKESDLRIAETMNGRIDCWWLRTPDTYYFNMVYGVYIDGGIGTMNVGGTEVSAFGYYEYGVRPAFCLPRDIGIKKIELNGEEVYVLDME